MKENTASVFEKAPVSQAVLKNAVPAMAAMLMVLIYNLADTFFIARTRSDILVAAVSLTTPVFLLFTAAGSIFGIGGTSVISRALGEGRREYAKKVCSFCIWSCAAVGIAMSAAFLLFMDQLLAVIGASAETWEPARNYLTVVALGGPFVLISNCCSNLLRAEGQPNRAVAGQVLGNLLNVVLDPLMILTFGWGITGAAAATVIGNAAGAGYYILYYLRGRSALSIRLRDFSLRERIGTGVLSIGIPASLGSLLMSVSQIVVNARMAGYGDMALAGMGVAMKVTMITGMICIGFGQGVQPLLGYCVGAGLWERFRKILRFSLLFSLGLSTAMTGVCWLLRGPVIRLFLTEPASFDCAFAFTGILLTTSLLFGVFYVLTNALQAMGAAAQALVINLSRQGVLYLPALFVLESLLQAEGLAWAQPAADLLSTALVAALYLWTVRRMTAGAARPARKNFSIPGDVF